MHVRIGYGPVANLILKNYNENKLHELSFQLCKVREEYATIKNAENDKMFNLINIINHRHV